MFTGIIEAAGKVTNLERQSESVRLTIAAGRIAEDVAIGDSVAINGVCLTVVAAQPPHLSFDAIHETMRKTTLGDLQVGSAVNLERALAVSGRLDGHIVQGHVDGTGRIASIRPVGNSWYVYIDAAPELMRYIVTKGSVAIDGISLTVAESADRTFAVAIIPHTWDATNLHDRHAGDQVNLETDILGKYVEKMLGGHIAGVDRGAPSGVSMDLLSRSGYLVATDTAEAEHSGGGGGRW